LSYEAFLAQTETFERNWRISNFIIFQLCRAWILSFIVLSFAALKGGDATLAATHCLLGITVWGTLVAKMSWEAS
jgi:hypothetical protein